VLIDAGFGRKLFDNMQSMGVSAEQVGSVFLPYMHGDHIEGLLRYLAGCLVSSPLE
jgi:metal-dependent hydrolase (beta-lactamase superfamily II)